MLPWSMQVAEGCSPAVVVALTRRRGEGVFISVTSRHHFSWFAGLESAHCALLIDTYLAEPQFFYVTEVLGPACIELLQDEVQSLALMGESKSKLCYDHATLISAMSAEQLAF